MARNIACPCLFSYCACPTVVLLSCVSIATKLSVYSGIGHNTALSARVCQNVLFYGRCLIDISIFIRETGSNPVRAGLWPNIESFVMPWLTVFVAKIQFECGQFRVVLFRYRGIEKNWIYDNTIALWIVHRSKPCKIFWPGVSCLYPNTHNTLRATTHKNPGMLFTGRDVIFQSTKLEKLAFFVSILLLLESFPDGNK